MEFIYVYPLGLNEVYSIVIFQFSGEFPSAMNSEKACQIVSKHVVVVMVSGYGDWEADSHANSCLLIADWGSWSTKWAIICDTLWESIYEWGSTEGKYIGYLLMMTDQLNPKCSVIWGVVGWGDVDNMPLLVLNQTFGHNYLTYNQMKIVIQCRGQVCLQIHWPRNSKKIRIIQTLIYHSSTSVSVLYQCISSCWGKWCLNIHVY